MKRELFVFLAMCAFAAAFVPKQRREVDDVSSSAASGSLTSVAPGSSTSVAPGSSTSVAPGSSTSVAPGSSTSVAPGSSTSVAPGSSTSVAPESSSSTVPGSSTSVAPGSSTSVAPGASTSVAPGSSTTAEPDSNTTKIICAPETICGWTPYLPPDEHVIQMIINKYCICGPGKMCKIVQKDGVASVFIHRCRLESEDVAVATIL